MITPKNAGYATITSREGVKEFDTLTCCHCGRAWCIRSSVKGQGDPGGWCMVCNKAVCPTCAGKECMPLMKRLENMEQRDKLFRSVGI